MNTSLPTNPEWAYKDATGCERLGYVSSTHDYGGTDITYCMTRSDGSGMDVLSGIRLIKATTTGRLVPLTASDLVKWNIAIERKFPAPKVQS